VVPGDISSAAFFLCAASLFPGSDLIVNSLLMNPTRARLLDVLISKGLEIAVTQLEEQHGELVGSLQVKGKQLRGGSLAGADTAALIDEIPVLAAIAPYSENGIEIRDASELRVADRRIILRARGRTDAQQQDAERDERQAFPLENHQIADQSPRTLAACAQLRCNASKCNAESMSWR